MNFSNEIINLIKIIFIISNKWHKLKLLEFLTSYLYLNRILKFRNSLFHILIKLFIK